MVPASASELLERANAARRRAEFARADEIYARCSDADLPERALVRFERARLLTADQPEEARQLAADALAVLRAAGDGYQKEATTIAAYLAR